MGIPRFLGSRAARIVLALGLCAGALPSAGGRAAAQEPDPLPTDSIAALTALVSKDTCRALDAADADPANGFGLPYVYCDDGVPPSGGGEAGIPVPVKYKANEAGDDWSGLPPPASVEEVTEATATDDLRPESDNRITLDVDVTLPPTKQTLKIFAGDPAFPVTRRPDNGYPVIVLMHGCCGGNKTSWEATNVDATNEQWHHSNAWFASRGYVVVTYTARGFRNSNDEGSTGSTQLDSRRYEVNDYQYLVGLLADHDALRRADDLKPVFDINPRRVAAVGGSYGGGWSWLATTDPRWRSPVSATRMKLAAAVPKYGWTDLVEALVPSGHYFDRDPKTGKTSIAPTDPTKAVSRNPIGVMKQSIVGGLYASGNLATGNHTTFPEYVHDAVLRLQQGEPYDGDPVLEELADTFLKDRSAYYQEKFWTRVATGLKVPLFVPATWTDPLFPTMESVRFYNKLKKVNPKYPITMYLGDYQHFVANKPKEWGDLCGSDHHVCKPEDYTNLNFGRSPSRQRAGVNTRINRFLDYYLYGRGRRPAANVSATTTICASNSSERYPADEPGIEYRAPSWRALQPGLRTFGWGEGGGVLFGTTSSMALDGHAAGSDPVARDRQADKCFTSSGDAGLGVVSFEHTELEAPFTMLGIPTVKMELETTATDYWVAVRLMDQAPDGTKTLVTRGVCRANLTANPERTCDAFDLWGNAWTFGKGHRVVMEVTQADTPMFRKDNFPSTIAIFRATLEVPLTLPSLKVDFRG